jgi:hypothetical protein
MRRIHRELHVADAVQGLRAGQKAAWGDTPCHGDVFHTQHQYEGLANTLSQLAQGATSRRKKLQIRTDRVGQAGQADELVIELELARQTGLGPTGWLVTCESSRSG